MAHRTNLPRGSKVRPQRLDPTLLSNRHDWILTPERGLSLRNTVEEADEPRTDLARFKLIAGDNRDTAKNLFSTLAGTRTLFRIPDTLHCDRTFTRDNEEAYYLDAMDEYLSQPTGDLDINDLPILRRRLHSRLHCAFGRKPGYRSELFERRRFSAWLCHDAHENEYFTDAENSALHPKTEAWYEESYLPPALAIPAPFVYYYFHNEMRAAQLDPDLEDSERNRRLKYCGRKEHYILAIAMWWNELFYGGKQYILDPETIDVLARECGTVPNIAGKPTQAILEHMRLAAQLPYSFHNWMCFNDSCMESSTFVFCYHGQARVDERAPSGKRFYCDKSERRITRTRYGGTIFKRVSVMERRLSAPDLDEVEGLLGMVDSKGWRAHGSLSVGNLFNHLVTLYRHTESGLADAEAALDSNRRELDYMRRSLQNRCSVIMDMEQSISDLKWRLENGDRRLREANGMLDDATRRIRALETPALRSAEQPRLLRLEDPYGPNQINRPGTRRVHTPNRATGGPAPEVPPTEGVSVAPQSPNYSPTRNDDGDIPAALPYDEIDLTRNRSHTGTPMSRVQCPQATPSRLPEGRCASRPHTPTQGSNGKRIKAGYPFFRAQQCGNLPWTVENGAKKRSQEETTWSTPATVVDTDEGTGPQSYPNTNGEKRARVDPGPSAGTPIVASPRETDWILEKNRRDPAFRKLAARHPATTALVLRNKNGRNEEEGQRTLQDGDNEQGDI